MPALPVRLSAYSRVRFIFCIMLTRYGRGGIHYASPQAGRTLHPRRTGVMNAAPTSVVERDRLPLCTKMNRTHYLHVSVQNMSRMVYCEARTGKPPAFCISYADYNYITTDGRAIGMRLPLAAAKLFVMGWARAAALPEKRHQAHSISSSPTP